MKSASSRSARPQTVKRKSTSAKSKTDWARLKASKASSAPGRSTPRPISPILFVAWFVAGLLPYRRRHRSLCEWTKTFLNGSRRKGPATKRASILCCAPSVMHRYNRSVHWIACAARRDHEIEQTQASRIDAPRPAVARPPNLFAAGAIPGDLSCRNWFRHPPFHAASASGKGERGPASAQSLSIGDADRG